MHIFSVLQIAVKPHSCMNFFSHLIVSTFNVTIKLSFLFSVCQFSGDTLLISFFLNTAGFSFQPYYKWDLGSELTMKEFRKVSN